MYYAYNAEKIIETVSNYKTLKNHDYPDDRIVELTDNMTKPDFEQGNWKHTENGPELVS